MPPVAERVALDSPPPFATVTRNNGVTRIRLRTPVAPWLRRATWIWILALPLNFVFLSAWDARPTSLNWLGPAVTAFEVFYVVAAFGIFILRMSCTIRIDIRYDGLNLFIREGGKRDICAMRADQILWVDVVTSGHRHLHIHPDRTLAELFSFAPSAALELHLDQGRARLFTIREKEELDWICAALRELLQLPNEPATQTPETSAIVSGLYGWPRIVLLAGGLLVSVLFLSFAARAIVPGLMTLKWAHVPGTVTHARYVEQINKPQDLAEISYRYKVLDKTYTSNRFGFGRDEEQKTLRDMIEAHPDGSEITVYYNPEDPSQAVVIPGFGLIGWLMLIPGVACLLLCIPLALRGSTKQQAALLRKVRNSVATRRLN